MKKARKTITCVECDQIGTHVAFGLCKKCYNRKHRNKNLAKYRASARRYVIQRYGITEDVFVALCEEQYYTCAICDTPLCMSGSVREQRACIDHDHKTGKVRGILCASCNSALGLFKDNMGNCLVAARYLEEHS